MKTIGCFKVGTMNEFMAEAIKKRQDGQRKGEIAKQEQPLKVNVPDGYIKPKTLSDIGTCSGQ
jgi:hypothetical protein